MGEVLDYYAMGSKLDTEMISKINRPQVSPISNRWPLRLYREIEAVLARNLGQNIADAIMKDFSQIVNEIFDMARRDPVDVIMSIFHVVEESLLEEGFIYINMSLFVDSVYVLFEAINRSLRYLIDMGRTTLYTFCVTTVKELALKHALEVALLNAELASIKK